MINKSPAPKKSEEIKPKFISRHNYAGINKYSKTIDILGHGQDIPERKQLELEYKTIIQTTLDGFWLTDMRGQFLDVNDAYCKLLGYSRDQLLKMSISDVEAAEKPVETQLHIARIKEAGGDRFETYHKRKDGKILDLEVSVNYIEVSGGRLVVFIRDITERKKTEKALLESEEKFSKAFRSNPNCMSITTQNDGNFLEVNDNYLRLVGYDREEIIGHSSKDLKLWAKPEERNRIIRKLGKSGKVVEEKYSVRTKAGEIRTMLLSAEPINISGDRCIIAASTDITERELTERALKESEEKFSAVFRFSPEMIIVSNLETSKYIEVNDSFVATTGYSREEIIGHPVSDINMFVDRQDTEKIARIVQEQGKIKNQEFSFRMKSGEIRQWLCSSESITINGDQCVIAIATDITERNLILWELQESEAQFRNLAEQSPNMIFINENGRLVYVNKRCEDIMGYTREEFYAPNFNFLTLIAPKYRGIVEENFKTRAKNMDGHSYEYSIITKDSREIECILSSKLISFNSGTAILGIVTDIAERKKMEEQIIMQDRLASIGLLSSGMAHELNNPLTSVIALSTLLLQNELADDAKEDLKIINDEAKRAAKIVKNLLTFARKQPKEKQLTDINEGIQKVLELRAYEQKVNHIRTNISLDPDLPLIMGNSFQFQQVFYNIVTNAEFFMAQAHKKGVLTVTTETVGNSVRVTFADDGPGISKEHLRRLFTPFFTTKEVGKGTGLGLSICQGIITEHSGRIWAESAPGKGAIFFLNYPSTTVGSRGIKLLRKLIIY